MMLREPWRTRLLFVSFALNLLLLPIAATRFMPHRPPITPGVPPTQMIIAHMARDLPPHDADLLHDTMDRHEGDIEAARVRMLAARSAMARAIGRAPYDSSAVQETMQTWQRSWQAWSEALGRGMLDALPGLSDQGRQNLAAAGHRRSGR